MADTMSDVLRATAGPDLYRLNAFRANGLPTVADRRLVRQRRQQVVAALSMGADVDGIPSDVDSDEVRAAFDRILEDPRQRLIDEMFWLWEVPGTDCGCPASLHGEHDRAVIAHGMALNREFQVTDPRGADRADLDRLWSEAAGHWDKVLRRNATWEHLRHRVRKLDDRRLDESSVDELRSGLPAALLRPLVALAVEAGRPERLSGIIRGWKGQNALGRDLLAEAASTQYEAVDTAVRQVRGLLDESAVDEAIRTLNAVTGSVTRLRALLPADESRRTANASELVAISWNNCANRLFEINGPVGEDRYDMMFDQAEALAVVPETRAAIRENRDDFRRVADELAALLDRITRLAASGQRGAAWSLASQMRVQLAGMPGAVDEINRVTRNLGAAGVGTNSRAVGAWIVLVAIVIGLCVGLANCDGGSDSAAGPGPEVSTRWTAR
ncbi:hypothetical protein [Actinoplanes sp. NBRC 103695]|uniref:hypothetical protein n=1 Tax=Actinoplanes sp. NBRC 103695 TaxID=3032202 RepID=UPI0025526611|nr:hypothetical protein [Actinoplanes sp. NBRC 103695]